ncbi:MAG: hypothetical protein PHP06_09810 [Clostridia bacterium]|nr:hypothetical protein [Clostridia bacterium]
MKISFIPQTRLGKWSVGLIIVFFLLFALFQFLVATGQRGDATIFDNLVLTIPIFIAGIAGIASFITGLTSIMKSKERSVFVFLASVIGLFVMLFVLGEIIFPH